METILPLCLSILLCIITNLQAVNHDNCTETLPSEWNVPYCPEDITRIEYQINMDPLKLTNNGANTVDQIDSFLKWIVRNFEEDKYLGEFRLRTSKIKKYYRTVTQLKIDPIFVPYVPSLTSLKYRRSFGSFQNSDSYDISSVKHQNDLTLEVAMSAPEPEIINWDYTKVDSTANYSNVFEYKLEPNVFPDTCSPTNWNNYVYGAVATSFSAKLEFDDDADIVPEDSDGEIMVDIAKWQNIPNANAFYGTDCSLQSCVCCDIEQYLLGFCSYFNYSSWQSFSYKSHIDYVVDIDFYYDKNKAFGFSEPTSEGKLTFQVQYDDLDAKDADIVSDGHDSAEFSVKLYKDDTVDGEWENVISFSESLIDDLVFPPNDIPPNEWFDYIDCAPISTANTTEYILTEPTEYVSNLSKKDEEAGEWFMIGVTFIVLFAVTALALCIFIWMYCKANKHGGYSIAETREIETGTRNQTTV